MAFQAIDQTLLDGNLSLKPEPQTKPTNTSSRILVIGGGVIGLTTAWVLLDRGYHVTILSKEWTSCTHGGRLTSQIAGALWEYPPAVCGQHTDLISLTKSKTWCMVAYRVWRAIAADPDLVGLSGVRMKRSAFFFRRPIEDDVPQSKKLQEIARSGVENLRHDPNLVYEHKVDPEYGIQDAYEHLAPVIDTDVAMAWLMTTVQRKGAHFITQTIRGDLFAQEDEIRAKLGIDIIVNATGLGGTDLAGDFTCYPIRGALIRVVNDGKSFEKVSTALTIPAVIGSPANQSCSLFPETMTFSSWEALLSRTSMHWTLLWILQW